MLAQNRTRIDASSGQFQVGPQTLIQKLMYTGTKPECWSILTYPKRHEPSLYIWETNRFDTLWAVETERDYQWGMVSNVIDAFEPSTARKTATIRVEKRKSDSTAWRRSAIRCQTRSNLPGNAQMGSPTPPAVFPRYCAVRLLLVSVDGTWFGWSTVPLILRHRKMAWFVDSLKRRTLLP